MAWFPKSRILFAFVLCFLAGFSQAERISLHVEKTEAGGLLVLENPSVFPVTASVRVPPNVENEVLATFPLTIPPSNSIKTHRILNTNITFQPELKTINRALIANSNIRFQLPCDPKKPCKVSQSVFGSKSSNQDFSHDDWARFAIDFDFSQGEPVFSVSNGSVLFVEDSNLKNCTEPTQECANSANRIFVLHDDMTIVGYLHLAPHSSKVKKGDEITAGMHIADAGATGFASGPHLHLELLASNENVDEITLPMAFCTQSGVQLLDEGTSYKSASCIKPRGHK